MNLRHTLILTTLLVSLLITACGLQVINGSGTIITAERPVNDFSRVNFTGFGELTLVQGEHAALTIQTDDNILPYIKTTARGDTLTISFDEQGWTPIVRPTQPIRFQLTVKTLTHLELAGAGTVAASDLSADHLTLVESGAGAIAIANLTATAVTVEMSGAGTIDLAGAVTEQTVDLSGLGTYHADKLASQTAQINLSGAGEATVWVSERLDAELSGAGTIRYYGSPQTNTSSTGIGSVKHLGEK